MHTFDWERIWLNDQPLHFLLEVIFRSVIMFVMLLVVLRLTGKRGVKQLSIFEVVMIIALGSAAGDPMFYEDVGILPALTVFFVILLIYRLVTALIAKSRWFEILIEGKTECLINDGKFSVHKFEKEGLAHDEFFTELRLKSVEHLGQVRHAYLETTGDVSVYFYKDEEVKYGLPITPNLFEEQYQHIRENGLYACTRCGVVKELTSGKHGCACCKNDLWVKAINTRRNA